ncbi:MAG: GNAT family N-acetyltransferase [Hyphomicrobiaceae bacterium]
MTGALEIRINKPTNLPALKTLYQDAFPTEDLFPLVIELLHDTSATTSIIAIVGTALVGHVIFTDCGVEGTPSKVALLGPLAVASKLQKQGIGSSLVRNGLQRLADDNIAHVFVLGDPAYYGRFGFTTEANIAPPYPLPEEWRDAWQAIELGDGERLAKGELSVPTPWRKPALWGP